MILDKIKAKIKEIKIKIYMSKEIIIVKENLHRNYKSFITEKNGLSFYAGLYDYMSYIIESGKFDDILDNIKKDEIQSGKKLHKINILFKKELMSVEKNILQIIKKNKIEFEDIKQKIETLETINKMEKREGLGTNLNYKYDFLVKILELLDSNGFKKQLKKYFQFDGRRFSGYEFSKFYNDHINTKKTFEESRRISIWGCWEELLIFYSILATIKGGNKKGIKKEIARLLEAVNHIDREINIKSIKEKSSDSMGMADIDYKESEFNIKKLKSCAKRIHNYIINELERKNIHTFKNFPNNKKEKIPIFFSKEKGFYTENKSGYPIKGNRSRLIEQLKDGKKDSALLVEIWGHNNITQLSKDIIQINKIFNKKLNQKEKIIVHIPTGGYKLNREIYSIGFINEP